MTWSAYGTFVLFAALVIIAPGPDFAVVVKNSLARGRAGGMFTSLGITCSCVLQGTLAAFGIGVILPRPSTPSPMHPAAHALGGDRVARVQEDLCVPGPRRSRQPRRSSGRLELVSETARSGSD